MSNTLGPLGWVEPANRTGSQNRAHAESVKMMVKFALRPIQLNKGEKVCLYDGWKHLDVIADVGFEFTRAHQLTGSCVEAGGRNAIQCTISSQRLASDKPTKAFMPFTYHNYGMSRHYMGDDSQGEGSLGSTFAKSLKIDGVRDWPNGGVENLPSYTYDMDDGIKVTSAIELAWSSYRNPKLKGVLEVAKNHLFGSTAECNNVEDIQAMVVNGYGVAFACNNYIGNASLRGNTEDEKCVVGSWNGRGGHQQSILAVWNHPTLGMLYWAQNNWDKNTYPRDPAGGPVCGCWVTEANVTAAMRLDSEVYGFSHLDWFPAQPKVREVLTWEM